MPLFLMLVLLKFSLPLMVWFVLFLAVKLPTLELTRLSLLIKILLRSVPTLPISVIIGPVLIMKLLELTVAVMELLLFLMVMLMFLLLLTVFKVLLNKILVALVLLLSNFGREVMVKVAVLRLWLPVKPISLLENLPLSSILSSLLVLVIVIFLLL